METFILMVALLAAPHTEVVEESSDQTVLLAQNGKKNSSKSKERKRIISGEGRTKKGASKRVIDFDDASIDGRRRTPTGVSISTSRPDQNYDLINLRLRWHPEMIQSTTTLETGRGR